MPPIATIAIPNRAYRWPSDWAAKEESTIFDLSALARSVALSARKLPVSAIPLMASVRLLPGFHRKS
jgi:hypothetical protein